MTEYIYIALSYLVFFFTKNQVLLAVDRPLQCDLLEYNSFDMKGNAVDITSLDF